jgi:hypothetical protein
MKTTLKKISFIDYNEYIGEEINPLVVVLILQVGIVQMFISDADPNKLDVITSKVKANSTEH